MGGTAIRRESTVDLVDGRKLVRKADERYRGGPEKPFTREELHAKFTDCASRIDAPLVFTIARVTE